MPRSAVFAQIGATGLVPSDVSKVRARWKTCGCPSGESGLLSALTCVGADAGMKRFAAILAAGLVSIGYLESDPGLGTGITAGG